MSPRKGLSVNLFSGEIPYLYRNGYLPEWHDIFDFPGTINSSILNRTIMANTGKTVATLLIGAAIGAAVGYILATDKDRRQEDIGKLKDKLNDIKSKLARKGKDLEEEIYQS
jgi:hypothetical protein